MAVATKGILGHKVGMTQVFDESARAIPVTVIEAGPCRVVAIRTLERDGYSAVQLAFDEVPARKLTKPREGHFGKAGVKPHRHLVELRVADAGAFSVGQQIRCDVFEPGERADVIGTTKGKGFSGVYKRHNFGGAPASHGTERKHRVPGSVGAGTTPSRVFKGQKMPGRLGHDRVTTLGLEVVRVDADHNVLLVKGAVPGPNGGLVMVRSSTRGRRPSTQEAAS